MDLKSLALYVTIIVASAGLAFFMFGQQDSSGQAPVEQLEKIDDPIWYRTASYGIRLSALKQRLALMTSRVIAPEQTGTVKDEIALLCRDDRLVDVVVDSFNSHPRLTPALVSAYMEICGRVNNPKLGVLLEHGFRSKEFDVRMNAADAGILHDDGRSVTEMGEAIQVASGMGARQILASLIKIASNESISWIEHVLEREEADLLVPAIRALGDAKSVAAIPRIRTRLEHPSPNVVIAAAGALATMGQEDGYQFLKRLADNPNADPLERSEAVQMLYTVSGRKNIDLFHKLAARGDSIGFEARLNLLKLRDSVTLAAIHQDVLEGNPHERVTAVGSLGASGVSEDVEFLVAHIEDMDLSMYRSMLQSLKRGRAPNATKAIAALAALARPESGLAYNAFPPFEEAGLDDLAVLVAEENDPVRRDLLLRTIATIPSKKSLEILESIKPGRDRDLWLLVRSLIRKVDLGILKK
ncbi:MAG: hypothetical protein ACI97A_002927 [Planctomycetota bacterium]|jgi:hypothetical protein